MIVDGRRLPCIRCGSRLYYHERNELICTSCARKSGVDRACDKERRAAEEKLN